MKTFSRITRVKVTAIDHPLVGKTGTVKRLRISDDGAWVKMDEELPENLESFPAGDERHHNIILYPEDCSAA